MFLPTALANELELFCPVLKAPPPSPAPGILRMACWTILSVEFIEPLLAWKDCCLEFLSAAPPPAAEVACVPWKAMGMQRRDRAAGLS